MKNVRDVIRPHYTNEEQTQIDTVTVDASNRKVRVAINKFGSNDELNPDWEWIHEFAGQEAIDANTNLYREEMAAKREREKNEQARLAGEKLFNLKLEIFEMDEIRASKNTKLKSKIRRAKNETHAMIYASSLVQQELNATEDAPEPKESAAPKPKKPPAKKRAPRKKKVNKVTIVDTINDDKRDK